MHEADGTGGTVWNPVEPSHQKELLGYSRDLLLWRLGFCDSEPPLPQGIAILEQPLGFFVTLRCDGALRGCIGSIVTEDPLEVSLRRRTLDAAFHDARFTPLSLQDIRDARCFSIEHSVLSPLQEVYDIRSIRRGIDGVVLTVGAHRAVFLPEVAVEQRWSVPVMLDRLARKAGLPADRWRAPGARFEVFQTHHYGTALHGPDYL